MAVVLLVVEGHVAQIVKRAGREVGARVGTGNVFKLLRGRLAGIIVGALVVVGGELHQRHGTIVLRHGRCGVERDGIVVALERLVVFPGIEERVALLDEGTLATGGARGIGGSGRDGRHSGQGQYE